MFWEVVSCHTDARVPFVWSVESEAKYQHHPDFVHYQGHWIEYLVSMMALYTCACTFMCMCVYIGGHVYRCGQCESISVFNKTTTYTIIIYITAGMDLLCNVHTQSQVSSTFQYIHMPCTPTCTWSPLNIGFGCS